MSQFLKLITRQQLQIDCLKIAIKALEKLKAYDSSYDHRLRNVTVKDHARRTSSAGNATSTKIEMNLHLNKTEKDYKETLLHEYAHSIVMLVHDDYSHGALWKSVMVSMDQLPIRCHDFDLTKAYPDRWTKVVCPGCGEGRDWSNRKMNKARRGIVYTCVCGTVLNPIKTKVESRQAARNAHPYKLKCVYCGFVVGITKRRRNNVTKRGKTYRHKGCGGFLELQR